MEGKRTGFYRPWGGGVGVEGGMGIYGEAEKT